MKPKYAVDEIEKAYCLLLCEKNHLDITVTDIAAKAGVARVSFYRNFTSIDDVLNRVVENILAEFSREVFPVLLSNDQRIWRDFLFRFIYKITDTRNEITRMLPENVPLMLQKISQQIEACGFDAQARETGNKYAPAGKLGMVTSIVNKWIHDGMQETPEEMVNCIMSLLPDVK